MTKKIIITIAIVLFTKLLFSQSIDQKYQQLGGAAKLGNPTGQGGVTKDGKGQYKYYTLNNVRSILIQATATSPVCLVKGEILNKWAATGYEGGALGYPTKGQTIVSLDGSEAVEFVGGIIFWRKGLEASIAKGDLLTKWKTNGYINSFGLPVTDEIIIGNYGIGQVFEKASMVWKAADRSVFILTGNEFNIWKASGAQNGAKGWALNRQSAGLVYEKNDANTFTPRKRVRVSKNSFSSLFNNQAVKKIDMNKLLGNPTLTKTLPDGTNVKTTYIFKKASGDNSVIGGNNYYLDEEKVNDLGKDGFECETKNVSITLDSDEFLTVGNLEQTARIYPGAIYSFDNFFNGSFKEEQALRNNLEISTSLTAIKDSSYEIVKQPSKNSIRDALRKIFSRFTKTPNELALGAFKSKAYEVFNSSDFALKVGAGGSYAGFSFNDAFNLSNKEERRYFILDATSELFTIDTEVPDGGYFADASKIKTPNLMCINNVTYGMRVLVSIETKFSNNSISNQFKASYSALGSGGNIDIDAFSKSLSDETTIKMYVVGGDPRKLEAVQNRSQLNNVLANLFKTISYQNVQPIRYSFTDMQGNKIGSQSATDKFIVRNCVPKNPAETPTFRVNLANIFTVIDNPTFGNVTVECFKADGALIAKSSPINTSNVYVNQGTPFTYNLNPIANLKQGRYLGNSFVYKVSQKDIIEGAYLKFTYDLRYNRNGSTNKYQLMASAKPYESTKSLQEIQFNMNDPAKKSTYKKVDYFGNTEANVEWVFDLSY